MNIEEIKETPIWALYEKGRNFHHLRGVYTDTDINYRMYNGDQWDGAKLGDVEPVQKNFIKPIIRYKNGIIHDNLYAINYSSLNFENKAFRKHAEHVCELLNKFAARVWEANKMDHKGRRFTKDAAINDEGIFYSYWNTKDKMPKVEIVKKNDIYYGNENDDDIQSQPYILIRKRMPVSQARQMALDEGVVEEEVKNIIGDNDTFEESGEAAKEEIDSMVTVITKMYKLDDTVHFAVSTRYLEIMKDKDSGLTYYPVSHMNWEEKEGSARGEGEVRHLTPNQIEVNRTEVRRIIAIKYQAYPQKIYNKAKITNPDALRQTGGMIEVDNMTVDDVSKVVGSLPPVQLSPDVKQLVDDMIQVTRDLAGAGDIATGQVNPEDASGRAILAIQQASQSPMTEQKEAYKNALEDLARIWLDMIIVYSPDGINLEEEITDPQTGQTFTQLVPVQQVTLQELKAAAKIDITPVGAFDRYAQELSIENLFIQGMFHVQRLSELKVYVKLLDEHSVMRKSKLEDAVKYIEEEQQKVAQITAQSEMMLQRANQFLMEDPQAQASQIIEAQQQMPVENSAENVEIPVEENIEE